MLQKACIREDGLAGLGSQVAFQFNPETLSFTKKAKFSSENTQSSQGGSRDQFQGTDPLELSLKMLLDDTVSQGFGPSLAGSVSDRVNKLLSWTEPKDASDPQPIKLVFEWGKLKIGTEGQFPCHCQSVQVDYSLFRDNGEPLRATATVKLRGVPVETPGQNPTSGGIHARRTRRVQLGDDLAVIAQQEYGKGSAWRVLADINGIDNPFQLPVGRELLLPERSELRSMN